jgi:hypothetical protein
LCRLVLWIFQYDLAEFKLVKEERKLLVYFLGIVLKQVNVPMTIKKCFSFGSKFLSVTTRIAQNFDVKCMFNIITVQKSMHATILTNNTTAKVKVTSGPG